MIYNPRKNARGYHASVPSNCCIFFANWWVWPASSDKRKAPLETDGLNHVITASAYIFRAMCYLMTKRLNYFWHGMSTVESWPWQISAWFSLELCIAFLKWFCAFLFSSLICSGLETLPLWNVCFSYSLAASIFSDLFGVLHCFSFPWSEVFILSIPFDRFSHITSFCHYFVEIITDTHIIFGHGLLIDYYLWKIVDIGNTADFITWNTVIIII